MRVGLTRKTIEAGSVKVPEKTRWIVEVSFPSYSSSSWSVTELENGECVNFYSINGGKIEASQLESLKEKLPKSLWLEIKKSNWDEYQGN